MSLNYIEIISKNYPNIGCSIIGDPSIYSNINWDNPSEAVSKETLDGLFLVIARNETWELVKQYRDKRKFMGIYVDGNWYHNDSDSRTQWLGLKDKARDVLNNGGSMQSVLTINHPTYGVVPIQWSTMSGTLVPVTVQLAFNIVEKTGDLDGLLYGIGQYHKAQIFNSQLPEEYNYKTLWPPVYGE